MGASKNLMREKYARKLLRRVSTCIKTKHSFAKIAEVNLYSHPESKNFTLRKVSKINLPDVKNAELPEKARRENCTRLYAQTAEAKRKFRLFRETTSRYIAALALKA
jgi:hypothetical protein